MRVEIISTGTEMMRGRSIDTNFAHVARQLTRLGYDVRYHSTYGDAFEDLKQGIQLALGRADVVIMTGGLGPTVDDLTRDAAAAVVNRPLEFHEDELGKIAERFKARNLPMPKINRRQAYFPRGATILANPVGSAPGFMLEHRKKLFFALPGPPREMSEMLPEVIRLLAARFGAPAHHLEKSFKIFGIPESQVEADALPIVKRFRNLAYGITAKGGTVSLNFQVLGPKAEETITKLRDAFRKRFDKALFGEDDDTIGEATARLLLERNRTIALAESCTGGLIADRLTDVPGISASLVETVVTYSNDSKIKRLGVPENLIAEHGAVSEAVARAMAEGVRKTSGANIGASTTGIAGPTGGTPGKPVGLVLMAVSTRKGTVVERRVFGGSRRDVKERATDLTLNLIRLAVMNE